MNSDLLTLNFELKKLCKKLEECKTRFIENKYVYNSDFLFFSNILNSKVINESPYKNLVFNYMKKAESYFPGGSYLLSDLFSSLNHVVNSKEKEIKTEKNVVSLFNMIDLYVKEKKYQDIIKEILVFSGPDASINCVKTSNADIEITKSTKPRISVNIHDELRGVYFSNQKTTTKDFIVVCMDAYIERESEIDVILSHCKRENLPALIFCRGISDYAIQNIKRILLKNNIKVYIYTEKFDDSDPFKLQDISKILGIDLYSVESGATVNTAFYESVPTKKIKVSSNYIEPVEYSLQILDEINSKIKDTNNQDLLKYLNKRKKRALPNLVEIKVPQKNIKLLNDIRCIINIYNNSAISGFVVYKGKTYPANTFSMIKSLSDNMKDTFSNLKCVVKLTESKK